MTRLAYELQKSGLPLPDGILTADELTAELVTLRQKQEKRAERGETCH